MCGHCTCERRVLLPRPSGDCPRCAGNQGRNPVPRQAHYRPAPQRNPWDLVLEVEHSYSMYNEVNAVLAEAQEQRLAKQAARDASSTSTKSNSISSDNSALHEQWWQEYFAKKAAVEQAARDASRNTGRCPIARRCRLQRVA